MESEEEWETSLRCSKRTTRTIFQGSTLIKMVKNNWGTSPLWFKSWSKDHCCTLRESLISECGCCSTPQMGRFMLSKSHMSEQAAKSTRSSTLIFLQRNRSSCSWLIMLSRKTEKTMASLRKVTLYRLISFSLTLQPLQEPRAKANRSFRIASTSRHRKPLCTLLIA